MGDYILAARRAPLCTLPDGLTVHEASFAGKPTIYGNRDLDKEINRRLRPTLRSWRERPLKACYLVQVFSGYPPNGGLVHRANDFGGTLYDSALGSERYPCVGMLLHDDGGDSRIVTAEDERAIWKAVGAWWKNSREILRDNPHYRPSLDVSQPDCLLAARIYDATAKRLGDNRRAYRYGADRPLAA